MKRDQNIFQNQTMMSKTCWCSMMKHQVVAVLVCGMNQCFSWHKNGFSIEQWHSFVWHNAIIGNFQDGCEKGAVSLHQSLDKLQQKPWQRFNKCSGEQSTGWTHVAFKATQTSAEEDNHTGRSLICTTPQNVTEIQQLINENQHLIIWELLRWWNCFWDMSEDSHLRNEHASHGS